MKIKRLEVSDKLYIVGLLGLLTGLSLVLFSLLILPNLLWKLSYDVPDFVLAIKYFLEYTKHYSELASCWLVFSIFFFPGLIFVFFAFFISRSIDEIVYANEKAEAIKPAAVGSESFLQKCIPDLSLTIKLMLLVLLVLMALTVFEWMLIS